jgi:hypothetical protein
MKVANLHTIFEFNLHQQMLYSVHVVAHNSNNKSLTAFTHSQIERMHTPKAENLWGDDLLSIYFQLALQK